MDQLLADKSRIQVDADRLDADRRRLELELQLRDERESERQVDMQKIDIQRDLQLQNYKSRNCASKLIKKKLN